MTPRPPGRIARLTRVWPAIDRLRVTMDDVDVLKRRVEELERELQECRNEIQQCRRLNRRLAEVTDMVVEVLLPAAERDEERLTRLLAAYHKTL